MKPRNLVTAVVACLLPALLAAQPSPTPTPAPNIDLRMIRMKISAGDLPSAESILEYHRTETGEDGDYVLGLAWCARGAALLGDWKAASSWSRSARAAADARLKTAADWTAQPEAVYALGTAIEVDAQALAAAGRKNDAIRFLEESSRSLEAKGAPYNIRARVWKRRNMMELEGKPAPAISAEDHVGAEAPSLESLRSKPLVLFFWWEACGDCRMQADAFRKVVEKYRPRGVAFVAPTRYYHPGDHAEEKAKIEKSWTELYKLAGSVPVPVSDEAMLRYGVSATPTFVFVNRKGIVTRYSATRMTEERLSAAIEELLK